MRANQKFVNDDAGQVGIGTMIVFIATILVAAVAAGVLIDTSGKLQERSSRTGNEATEKVSGNFEVVKILGRRDGTGDANLMDLDIFLTVAPGAPKMDVNQLRVQVKTTTAITTFNHTEDVNPNPAASTFASSEVRDADGSYSHATEVFVVNAGDMVNLTFDLSSASLTLAPRSNIELILIPEVGNKIVVGFTTPTSYGTDLRVTLV